MSLWDCRSVDDPLTDPQRATLGRFLAAKAGADSEQREQMLNATGTWLAEAMQRTDTRPVKDTRGDLERVAAACKRLDGCIGKLVADLDLRVAPWWENLLWLSEPPVQRPDHLRADRPALDDFLARLRSDVGALHQLAEYAQSQLSADAASRPSLAPTRFLVLRLAESFTAILTRPVPVSKLTWFPEYVAQVCAIGGLAPPDPDTIRALIRSAA
jgi:hypothetical protein